MTTQVLFPLPPTNFQVVLPDGRPSLAFGQWLDTVNKLVQLLNQNSLGPLTGVAVPTNANAAAAGVPLNGLYRSTADPATIFVRTV
jgi:hypothetical protein